MIPAFDGEREPRKLSRWRRSATLSAEASVSPEATPEDGAGEAPAKRQAREARSATVVAAAILVSKLVGLVRQRIVAHFFGTELVADVIAAAFRVGNLAQNLLGEGTLSASFIPIYAKLRGEGKDDEAVAFARSALGLLMAVVLILSALGVALAPWLAILVAAGFDENKRAMTADLVRIVFPMTGLLVLCAWALGVLNAHRRFFVPYVAPVIWSAGQIGALLVAGGWLAHSGEPLARILAYGALGGAALELAWLLYKARPYIGLLRPAFDARSRHVREAAKRLPSVLLGRGVIQISGLVDTLLVSFLGTGATAVFVYAQTLYLLPMSVIGTGEAAVSLPEMARDSAQADEATRHRLIRERLGATMTRIVTLAVPAVAVLVIFAPELITLLLRTGRFDADSTARVADALRVYGVALIGNASGRMFAVTFFALGEPRLPGRLAVVRVVVSTLLALWWMGPFGVVGVVLGAATAGWLEALLLGFALRRRLGGLGLGALPAGRLLALAALTAGVPYAIARLVPFDWQADALGSLALLAVTGAAFAAGATLLRLIDLRRLLGR
jgi:putative peptidoglycan lipid II flippase